MTTGNGNGKQVACFALHVALALSAALFAVAQPVITSIMPSERNVGSANFTLSVDGTGFATIPPTAPILLIRYWDQASVLVQLGLLDPAHLPVSGAETAWKVLDPGRPSNDLIRRAAAGSGDAR